MSGEQNNSGNMIISLVALANALEDEGQNNTAKLARAAAESLVRKSAYQQSVPKDKAGMAAELARLTQALRAFEPDAELLAALERGVGALHEGKLMLFQDTPNPFVCRVCGYLSMGKPPTNCPTCGSRPGSFIQVMPNYWFDALDPFESMETMRETPKRVAELMEGLTPEQLDRAHADETWAIYNVVSHLRDAQQVLAFRMNLMLTQENPPLESLAIFEWADQEQEKRPTVRDIFETYLASRRETIARLEQIPLRDWWRTGQHQEFGKITLKQQVSYFIAHEVTHLPQIESLRA